MIRSPSTAKYRRLSFWHDSANEDWTPRPALSNDVEADVAIVGAGFTGLWTAYYLASKQPSLKIVVLEREVAGFGASGRSGGWCSAIFPATLRKVASISSRSSAVALQQKMNETVEEVGRVTRKEGIDCHFAHGGYVSVARNQAQWARAQAEVSGWRSWGFGEDHMVLLDSMSAQRHFAAPDVLGATYTPHCAAIQPTLLVRGLARACERLGVEIYQQTPVAAIEPHHALTADGSVRAETVVRATEGYTPDIPGMHRSIVPMYSLMVVTEPLPLELFMGIGLRNRETFSDKRHLRIYGQRTADDRIAFGGRGAPYHFGSTISASFDRDQRVHRKLRRTLTELLPEVADYRFTHAWGGNLGIPRDWCPSITYNAATGLATAGGYIGDGIATANLAGRILADILTGEKSDLTLLPIVGHISPTWEPEPLRWVGVNAGSALFAAADLTERITKRPSRMAKTFWSILGH